VVKNKIITVPAVYFKHHDALLIIAVNSSVYLLLAAKPTWVVSSSMGSIIFWRYRLIWQPRNAQRLFSEIHKSCKKIGVGYKIYINQLLIGCKIQLYPFF